MKTYKKNGFALITVLLLMALLLSLLAAYSTISRIELATTRHTKSSVNGFYAAEAGLNVVAEEIRQAFLGYNRPSGTSPTSTAPCEGSNVGSGDFACQYHEFGGRSVVTYVSEDPANPIVTTIPPGELYQNLNAQEYRYTVNSRAINNQDHVEAILELRFKSRLVPLFQFVAFYDKDLEILPGQNMNLSGPVHTNGDLYLNSDATLTISGQVTTAGSLFRGRKNTNACNGTVRVMNPATAVNMNSGCTTRTQVTNVTPWNGMVRLAVDELTVPEPEILDPISSSIYYTSADLRLALKLNASNAPDTTNSVTGVEVRNSDGSVNTSATTSLNSCTGAISGRPVGSTVTFYNQREAAFIRMLEVDYTGLFNCLHSTSWFGTGKLLSDSTEGGLVFHFTVDGPNSNVGTIAANNYGVRVRNATELRSTTAGAPTILGLTVVSDQAFYTWGHYNSTNKKPAAIMADSFHVLSSGWSAADPSAWASRNASNTTINAAILAGTDTTGGIEGTGGQGGAYNGGLENYPRLHENWTGDTLTYRGSFVSLGVPRHVDGAWFYGNPQYTAPTRNWDYDTSFNNAANLPPLSPRFVYLRQELFVRQFEQ